MISMASLKVLFVYINLNIAKGTVRRILLIKQYSIYMVLNKHLFYDLGTGKN
jgi:hypothetical protein